jgi:hypothetical protein
MKLKCVKHDRRVMILENTGKWVHRTGDLSDCDSLNAKIGNEDISRGTNVLTKIDLTRESVDPAQRLLYDIFADRS